MNEMIDQTDQIEKNIPKVDRSDRDLTAIVQKNYVQKIGRPTNFMKMAGSKTGFRTYRMTMWIRKGDFGAGIGPSHIVTTDENGQILAMK